MEVPGTNILELLELRTLSLSLEKGKRGEGGTGWREPVGSVSRLSFLVLAGPTCLLPSLFHLSNCTHPPHSGFSPRPGALLRPFGPLKLAAPLHGRRLFLGDPERALTAWAGPLTSLWADAHLLLPRACCVLLCSA